MSDAGLEKLKQKMAQRAARFPGTAASEVETPEEKEKRLQPIKDAALPIIRAMESAPTESESDIHVIRDSAHRKGDRNRYRNTPPSR